MGMQTREAKFPSVEDTVVSNVKTDDLYMNVTMKPVKPRAPVFRRLPYGYVDGVAPLCMDANDRKTQEDGLMKRLGQELPVRDPVKVADLKAFVARQLEKIAPLDAVMTTDEWLDSTHYSLERKKELKAIADRLAETGLPGRRKLGAIKPFVKRESYPMLKHCRWINAPNDKFKVVCGPAFKSMEKVIYGFDWFGLGHSNFVKHLPVTDRPLLIEQLERLGFKFHGTDFTAFEAHMTEDIMDAIECQVYAHMLKKFPGLAHCICSVLKGERAGTTSAGVYIKSKSRRMSGDCCTSLGNGLTNLLLWAYLCEKKNTGWDGYVEGDDGIFVCTGEAPTTADYEAMGFKIKMVSSMDPADLSFCGLVISAGVILRDPCKFIQNFGWTGSFVHSKQEIMIQMLRAKALSALYETPSCPLVSAIAARAKTITDGHTARFVLDAYHNTVVDGDEAAIPWAARIKFQELYGISPAVQIESEHRIKNGDDLKFLRDILVFSNDVLAYSNSYVELG